MYGTGRPGRTRRPTRPPTRRGAPPPTPRHRRRRRRGCARPRRIGRGGARRGRARPRPRAEPRTLTLRRRARDASTRASSSSSAASALARLFAERSPGQTVPADLRRPEAGDRDVHEADGLRVGAAVRPGDPGDADAEVRAESRRARPRPSRWRPAPRRRRGPRAASAGRPDRALDLRRCRTRSRRQVRGRTRHLGQQVGDEAAGARLGRSRRSGPAPTHRAWSRPASSTSGSAIVRSGRS